MDEAGEELFDDTRMSLREHSRELSTRLVLTATIPLLVAVGTVAFLASANPWGADGPSPADADRVLWGCLAGAVLFHYLLLYHGREFVGAGLYPAERRAMRVPFVWMCLLPVMAFGFTAAFTLAVRLLGADLLADPAVTRAWLVRFYLLGALATLLLSLPRQARPLHPSVFVGVLAVSYFLPDHLFDTLLAGLAEVWVVVLAAAGLGLWLTRPGGG